MKFRIDLKRVIFSILILTLSAYEQPFVNSNNSSVNNKDSSIYRVDYPNKDSLIVIANLTKICNSKDSSGFCPYCGYIHTATVCVYDSIKVLKGKYNKKIAYIVVPCIEIPRKEYDENAGNLIKFSIGSWNKLLLSDQPVNHYVICNDCKVPKNYYFLHCWKADSIKSK